MSPCFPFPPPGYLMKSDALIEESIKIRLDLDLEKKKREKKEKRDKEHKHKDSTSSHATTVGTKFKFNEVKEPKDNGKLKKVENHENEQLGRGGLTEEHDQPVSDSSQSSKRKRGSLLPSQDNGPPIKLRKHQEPEESKQGFQLGSSSTSVGLPSSHSHEARTNERPLQAITKVESKQGFQLGSSSRSVVPNSHTYEARRVERPLQGITKADTTNQLHQNPTSKVCKPLQNLVLVDAKPANETVNKESRRVEALYKSLLNIQAVTYELLDSLDQDWLFSSVLKEAKPFSKKQKTDAFQCSKSLWPRAQYMPEIDIYALPYTIPF
ncbi:hypothetical protein L195_g030912 [Trifolium pratense]|uniref:Uncharacterized protein n=2 Tax=Trifolium pratense TaxID=57577 RepID=A0A2K3L8Y3_TRIPR|nr:hypothetical protein L195_g030912 [Trifolium pratense]